MSRQGGVEVYDVQTGKHVTLPGQASDYGWTADGRRSPSRDTVDGLLAGDGDCSDQPLPDGVRLDDAVYFVRLGGAVYES